MTDKLIEQIKRDRESGTPGPWDTDEGGEVHHFGTTVFAWPLWSDQSALERVQADMRRGKSVPDYESRILADAEVIKAAEVLAEAVSCITSRRVSPATGGRLVIEAEIKKAEQTLDAFYRAMQRRKGGE